MRPSTFGTLIVGLALLAGSATADTWTAPREKTVHSANREWRATLQPDSTPFRRRSVQATVAGPDEQHSFALRGRMPLTAVLLDDGRLLTLDEWGGTGRGDSVAVLYAPDGVVAWHANLRSLIGDDRARRAPKSVSSTRWRTDEWCLRVGDAIHITLFDEDWLELDLSTGTSRVLAIEALGDDPERLRRRAQARARASRHAEAAAAYRRLVGLLPDDRQAHAGLVMALGRLGRSREATEILQAAAERFRSGHLAELYHELGTSQLETGDRAGAIASFTLAVDTNAARDQPVFALAGLLWADGREQDLEALLRTYQEAATRAYSDPDKSVPVIVGRIAEFHASHGAPERALALLEESCGLGAIERERSCQNLAAFHARAGDTALAVAIHERLIAHWNVLGSSAREIAASQRVIQRLRPAPAPGSRPTSQGPPH